MNKFQQVLTGINQQESKSVGQKMTSTLLRQTPDQYYQNVSTRIIKYQLVSASMNNIL
jgi:hypothetical protein